MVCDSATAQEGTAAARRSHALHGHADLYKGFPGIPRAQLPHHVAPPPGERLALQAVVLGKVAGGAEAFEIAGLVVRPVVVAVVAFELAGLPATFTAPTGAVEAGPAKPLARAPVKARPAHTGINRSSGRRPRVRRNHL